MEFKIWSKQSFQSQSARLFSDTCLAQTGSEPDTAKASCLKGRLVVLNKLRKTCTGDFEVDQDPDQLPRETLMEKVNERETEK